MIKIRDLNNYMDSCMSRIDLITKSHLISTENQLVKKVADFDYSDIVLIIIIPSADSKGKDVDNIIESETIIMFILGKIDESSEDDDDFIDNMEIFQNTVTELKELMIADKQDTESGCHLMKGLDLSSIHTDPEYNYLGCNGYSLSCNVTSHEF